MREVAVVESGDDLGIYDDGFVNNEIGDKPANELVVVVDWKLLLLITDKAPLGEFDDEDPLIKFFIKAGFKGEKHFVSGSDDLFGEFVGFHKIL